MSRAKRSPAVVRAKPRAIPMKTFVGVNGEPLPTSADRIANVDLHGVDRERASGEFWEFSCDMRAVIAKLFAAFADDLLSGEANLFITGKTRVSRRLIEAALPAALRLEAQRRHTEGAALLFRLRIHDVLKWAVEFASVWAQITTVVMLSDGSVAVTGEGFQATAQFADESKNKADWRDLLRKLASDFVEPFVRNLHGKPGQPSKLDRDLDAKAYRNRRIKELQPSHGKQRAMEIAKRETMRAFDLKTDKVYRNAMERKQRGAAPPKRRRPKQDVN